MPNISAPSAPNIGGMKSQLPYNPSAASQKVVSQPTPSPILTDSEEFVLNAFERYRELYASIYQDDNKQKDFNSKIQALQNKLRNHEVKQNVLNILNEFINGRINFNIFFISFIEFYFEIDLKFYLAYDNNAGITDLKKLSTKIQSNGWDQNKNWMPCIDKIISIPRK